MDPTREDRTAASSDEFCALLSTSFTDADVDDAEGMAALRTLAAEAPAELSGDFDVFLGAMEKLDALDENDPATFDEAFAIALDPNMIKASTNLEEFASSQCGIDLALVDSGSLDDGPPPDDGPPNGEIDPNVISLDGVDAYLDEQFGDTSWRSNVNGYTLLGDRELEVSGDGIEADAVEICNAVIGYAIPIDPEATVKVTDDTGAVVHASNITDDGSCQPG